MKTLLITLSILFPITHSLASEQILYSASSVNEESDAVAENLFMTFAGDDEEIVEKGFRLQPNLAAKNYQFLNKKIYLDKKYTEAYIKKVNPKISNSDVSQIYKAIDKVANCLKIDSFVLTGMIQKESTFNKNAVSQTGAAGLTQFTSIGIKEVNDQLGINGNIGAPSEVTEYFRNTIYGCINPKWIDVWKMTKSIPGTKSFYNDIKALLKNDILTSVTYGGILLKTYVANLENRNITQNLRYSPAEVYFYALQNYNGEPGVAKVNYAKRIFEHVTALYPTPVRKELNFPFLKK